MRTTTKTTKTITAGIFLVLNLAGAVGIACSAPAGSTTTDKAPSEPKGKDASAPNPNPTSGTQKTPLAGDAGSAIGAGADCKDKKDKNAAELGRACLECCDEAFPTARAAGNAKWISLVCAPGAGGCQAACASTVCANPPVDGDNDACWTCIEPHISEWSAAADAVDAKDPATIAYNACNSACAGDDGPGGASSGGNSGGADESNP